MARVVLITGASGGLGKVLAKTLQSKGLQVFGTMRNPDALSEQLPFPMLAMDVTDEGSVQSCIKNVIQLAGRIDVVINTVNEMILGSVLETSIEEFKRMYDVNILGVIRVSKAVLPFMQAQDSGTIINMSSLGGLLAVPYLSGYTSSKFAIEAFSEALYHEVKKDNIDIVIMQPVAMRMERPATGNHLKTAAAVGKSSDTRRLLRRMEQDTLQSRLTPEQVSEAIFRVIQDPGKPLRKPLDRAKGLTIVKRFAPQFLIDKLIGRLLSAG
jgi:NADP-dependent 3-hydroxy acid dehydrogenase YdfG